MRYPSLLWRRALLVAALFSLCSGTAWGLECKVEANCTPCTLKLVPAEARAIALTARQAIERQDNEEARRLYNDLKEALGEGNCNPTVQLELGKLWTRTGNKSQAVVELERLSCLESEWDGNCAPPGLNLQGPIEEARALLGKLKAELREQTVALVQVNVDGAYVRLQSASEQKVVAEGRAQNGAFSARGLAPGRYLVDVSAGPGFEAKQQEVLLDLGQTSEVSILLVRQTQTTTERDPVVSGPLDSGVDDDRVSPLGVALGAGFVLDEDFGDSVGVTGHALLSYEVAQHFEPEFGALIARYFAGPWLGANVYLTNGASYSAALEPGAYLLFPHAGDAKQRDDILTGLHLGLKLGFGPRQLRFFLSASAEWFPGANEQYYDRFFGLLGGGIVVRSL
jgi:hypothetical protein